WHRATRMRDGRLEIGGRGGHPEGHRGGRWRREARQHREGGPQAQDLESVGVVSEPEPPWSWSARSGPAPLGTPYFLLGRLMATPGALKASRPPARTRSTTLSAT